MKKDVIYIDIEEDITSVITKLKAAKTKIVALVPPKRATLFTSLVNLKLLKKAAHDNKKKLVLITNEASIKSLAAGLDIYVAKNLTTAPTIPQKPKLDIPSDTIGEATVETAESATELAKKQREAASEAEPSKDTKTAKEQKKALKPITKSIKVPNFDSFRKKLFFGLAGVVVLAVGWWQLVFVLPTAQLVLHAQTTSLSQDFELVIDQEATAPDFEARLLPAQEVRVEQEVTATATATGEENRGDAASGQMTIYNETGVDRTLVEDTRFRASNGQIFRLNSDTVVPGGSLDDEGDIVPGSVTKGVTADEPGGKYNIPASNYTIPGLSNDLQSKIYGRGDAMGGGTDELVSVLQESDVALAAEGIDTSTDDDAVLTDVRAKAGDSLYVFDKTLEKSLSDAKSNEPIGSEVGSSVVTIIITHTAWAVDHDQLRELILSELDSQIGEQQQLVDDPVDGLLSEITDRSESRRVFDATAIAAASAEVDTVLLAEQLVGTSVTEAQDQTVSIPGIIKTDVALEPFYVSSLPRSADKITIEVREIQE